MECLNLHIKWREKRVFREFSDEQLRVDSDGSIDGRLTGASWLL